VPSRPAELVDTHAHLSAAELAPDLEDVLARARSAGVDRIIAVSETPRDAVATLAIAEAHPELVRAAAGLHPEHPDRELALELVGWMRRHRDRLVAVGEVGLDRWRVQDEPRREVQISNFQTFIELAEELDLPLNVHSRSAGERTVALLLERNARRVQLHAFDGRASKALPAVEAGYFFSIPPSVVRSPQKQKLVRRLPLSCLLLETDSPVLGPAARERNEPRNLLVALRAVSELKDLPEDAVREAVAENGRRLYGAL
jgi:TatD DNase family protein